MLCNIYNKMSIKSRSHVEGIKKICISLVFVSGHMVYLLLRFFSASNQSD